MARKNRRDPKAGSVAPGDGATPSPRSDQTRLGSSSVSSGADSTRATATSSRRSSSLSRFLNRRRTQPAPVEAPQLTYEASLEAPPPALPLPPLPTPLLGGCPGREISGAKSDGREWAYDFDSPPVLVYPDDLSKVEFNEHPLASYLEQEMGWDKRMLAECGLILPAKIDNGTPTYTWDSDDDDGEEISRAVMWTRAPKTPVPATPATPAERVEHPRTPSNVVISKLTSFASSMAKGDLEKDAHKLPELQELLSHFGLPPTPSESSSFLRPTKSSNNLRPKTPLRSVPSATKLRNKRSAGVLKSQISEPVVPEEMRRIGEDFSKVVARPRTRTASENARITSYASSLRSPSAMLPSPSCASNMPLYLLQPQHPSVYYGNNEPAPRFRIARPRLAPMEYLRQYQIAKASADSMGEKCPLPKPGLMWCWSENYKEFFILPSIPKGVTRKFFPHEVETDPVWKKKKRRMPLFQDLIDDNGKRRSFLVTASPKDEDPSNFYPPPVVVSPVRGEYHEDYTDSYDESQPNHSRAAEASLDSQRHHYLPAHNAGSSRGYRSRMEADIRQHQAMDRHRVALERGSFLDRDAFYPEEAQTRSIQRPRRVAHTAQAQVQPLENSSITSAASSSVVSHLDRFSGYSQATSDARSITSALTDESRRSQAISITSIASSDRSRSSKHSRRARVDTPVQDQANPALTPVFESPAPSTALRSSVTSPSGFGNRIASLSAPRNTDLPPIKVRRRRPVADLVHIPPITAADVYPRPLRINTIKSPSGSGKMPPDNHSRSTSDVVETSEVIKDIGSEIDRELEQVLSPRTAALVASSAQDNTAKNDMDPETPIRRPAARQSSQAAQAQRQEPRQVRSMRNLQYAAPTLPAPSKPLPALPSQARTEVAHRIPVSPFGPGPVISRPGSSSRAYGAPPAPPPQGPLPSPPVAKTPIPARPISPLWDDVVVRDFSIKKELEDKKAEEEMKKLEDLKWEKQQQRTIRPAQSMAAFSPRPIPAADQLPQVRQQESAASLQPRSRPLGLGKVASMAELKQRRGEGSVGGEDAVVGLQAFLNEDAAAAAAEAAAPLSAGGAASGRSAAPGGRGSGVASGGGAASGGSGFRGWGGVPATSTSKGGGKRKFFDLFRRKKDGEK
ncbi:hypothetical protein C8034_v008571 [Colletotrichum sidae]|uniref:Uncharacterized protein n=1 Tax=Colletotrichum sidae TaxID=1347389 RepID=A0A4R8TPW0_9PEZI|nr:hypothetical protein C8034_v008571 [Colletotrichum sidae]